MDTIAAALAVGLNSAEAGRRVGWARAYEALRRIDSISEDLRQTRDELKWLRRAYSRLLGFTYVGFSPAAAKTAVWRDEIWRHLKAEETFRHDDAWDSGVARGWEHRAIRSGWSEEELAAQKLQWAKPWIYAPPRPRDSGRPGSPGPERLPGEGLSKAKKQAHYAFRRALWDLFRASEEIGHKLANDDWEADEDQPVEGKCSCGDTSGVVSRFDAVNWKRNHAAWSVHHMSYAEWASQVGEVGGTPPPKGV